MENLRDRNIRASINYGLERLNLQIENAQNKQEGGGIYLNKEMPGMEILDKFLPFNKSDLHFKWATLLLVCNIYNFFTVAYFIGFEGFPSGFWFALETASESLLLLDLIMRMTLKSSSAYKKMWFMHEKSSFCSAFSLLLSSIPYSLLCLAYTTDHHHWGIALIRLPKLLRLSQINTYFTNMKIIRRSSGWVTIEFLRFLLLVLLITHYTGMLMMFIDRIELENNISTNWPSFKSSAKSFTDMEFWALGSLASVTISNLVPTTLQEKMVCVFYIVIGTSVFGAIFAKIVEMLGKNNLKNIESNQKLETAKNWMRLRKLSDELRIRVLNFYSFAQEKFADVIQYEFLNELPLSLKTEISLYLHKDLIPKVKLFELGDPAFMMGIVRHLKPKLYMTEDYIIRKGDYAEEFFFIRVGSVEVLATDETTAICILEEGAYFGEIGILLDVCRTVSVKATIATLVSSIHRTALMSILNNFPEHLHYLRKVAEQRLETTNTEDFDTEFDLLEDESDDESISSEESESEYYAPAEHKNKTCFERFITVAESKAVPNSYQIDAYSRFYYIWSVLMISSFAFYLFYLPFCISFESEGSWLLFALDFLAFAIYVLDIFVAMNSSILTEFGNYVHDSSEIEKNYYNRMFFADIISIIPADYLSRALTLPIYVTLISKIVRLGKIWRVQHIVKVLKSRAEVSVSLIRIIIYIPVLVYLSHLTACLFYMICVFQYKYIDSNGGFLHKYYIDSGKDFLEQSVATQYVEYLFFTTSIISSNTYNIIFPVSIIEESFCFILLIISRLLLAFLLAESSTLIGCIQKPYTDQLAKLTLIKEWIDQYQIPASLKNRIINHYKLLWVKLNGVEDSEIVNDLPESLQTDINYFLFSSLISSGFFPPDEQGAIRSIIKKCRVLMQCAGEEIISEGELGLEMYFILEGDVEITTHERIILNTLTRGHVFGEMALMAPFPTVRGATAIAKTDVTLAALSMDDFNFVMQIYPEFARKVRIQASEREQMNRKVMHSANVEALRKHKKLSVMVKNRERVEKQFFTEERFEQEFLTDEIAVIPVKIRFYSYFLRFHQSAFKEIAYMSLTVSSLVFMPLILAFDYSLYQYIIPETIIFVSYMMYSLYFLYIWFSIRHFPIEMTAHYFPYETTFKIIIKTVHNFILSLPLLFLFNSYLDISGVKLVIVIIRLTSYIYAINAFNKLKQKLEWFLIVRVSEVLFHFVIISHIFACIFIDIASWEANNNWIELYYINHPHAITKFNIYIHSTYWAFTCLSHASLGDVLPISIEEKLYNSFVCIFGCFVYVLLFGNICSLVSEFASKLRGKLFDSYSLVIDFIEKKRVQGAFKRQVNDYFNYLWQSNKGSVDQEILKQLPIGIMSDVQIFRYSTAIQLSTVFKDSDLNINYQLTRTLFRLMEIEFYLIGDNIIKIGDKSLDMFIILQGEVDVISLNGEKVIATLKTGDHFGEANILHNNSIRTAGVIASKISQIGVISREDLEKMFLAYPDWKAQLTEIAAQRLNDLFNTQSLSDAKMKIGKINDRFESTPQALKVYIKKAEKLLAPKIIEKASNPIENNWFKMSILHLVLIVFSAFAIPIEIAFDYPVENYLLYIESFLIVESLGFFLITCKYAMLSKSRGDIESKDLIKFFYQNYVVQDIVAFAPFNLVFPVAKITQPEYIIVPLRMLRLISVARIPSLVSKIETHSRGFISLIRVLKSIFFLVLLMHWTSSIWYFTVKHQNDEETWLTHQQISTSDQSSTKWVHSIYYLMNIATGTGYSDTYPKTLLETLLTILFILIGNFLFAVAFGLIASLTSLIKSRINTLLEKLQKCFEILNKSDVPVNIITRLEAYYSFTDSLTQTFGDLNCKMLYKHLPKNIVNKITYECNKHILKKMPFFRDHEFEEMTEKISLHMIPKIYLPNDYIIYKNDVGEEMYFVILGIIDILSSDNNKVIKTLGKGDYVGEVALLFDSKRLCSVVARATSLLYLLGKKAFREIIKDYPKALEIMMQESNKRKAEASFIQESQKRNISALIDEAENIDRNDEIVKTLNLYNAMSTPFFSGAPMEKNMTALAGMNNVKSDLVRDTYIQDSKDTHLYKRRPSLKNPNQRRFSQESLGKEIVLSNFSKLKMQWIVE